MSKILDTFVKLTNRSVLTIGGKDAYSLLQGICTQDIEVFRSSPRLSTCAYFLNPKGKILFDTIITKIPPIFDLPDGFLLDIRSA